ncbi:MAG: hypothetical protein LR017_00110 [Candidatus Pacebacteria bacterium]|nr:hypothetical protein [Candidatus Paceibacterota bacterium]
MDASVTDGRYGASTLPESGYVHGVDQYGVALLTGDTGHSDYHHDYVWTQPDGTYSMMRGGFYGSGTDAGLYSIQAAVVSEFSGVAVGFRCVKDI